MDAVRQFLLSGADALIAQGFALHDGYSARRDDTGASTRMEADADRSAGGCPRPGGRRLRRRRDPASRTSTTRRRPRWRPVSGRSSVTRCSCVRRFVRAPSSARHHADVILRWSDCRRGMDAAIFMSRIRRRSPPLAGRLIGGLAMPGGALRLFSDALRANHRASPSNCRPILPRSTVLRRLVTTIRTLRGPGDGRAAALRDVRFDRADLKLPAAAM